jgi:murein DD-endopeptidase MepM/ murein hydrolase activator NlpD
MTKLLAKITISALISMAGLVWVQASSASDQILPVNTWNPPLETPIRLVNQYRQPNSDYSAGHRGVDYLVELGQEVFAPADGQIWFSRKVGHRNVLSMSHAGGYLSEVEPVCSDLTKGEPIFQGQQVGEVCAATSEYRQHCQSATCLHFSLRKDGAYLSPLIFIGGLNPSRLLPIND